MKTIIAATDFSSVATNAANYAADMAESVGANLLLLHTFEVPIGYMEVPVAVDLEALKRSAEAEINKCQKLLAETKPNLTITSEVRMGIFFQELKTVCERVLPYAVVMGSQGSTAAERLLFGSRTVYAMKHLAWPLVTVPPGISFHSIKKIGLACDFEEVTSTVPIEEIKMLVNDFHAELHVINMGSSDQYNPETVFGSSILKTMLGSINPQIHLIYEKNIDETIMDLAESMHIDLLIVLPKKHGFMEKIVNKSHSKQMVLHSHVPVLALHPPIQNEL